MPFTTEEFFNVFKNYNLTFWPLQIILNLLAVIVIILIAKKRQYSDKVVSAVLAFFWIWVGIAYHLIFFTEINPAAYAFGGLFIIQGFLFIKTGLIDKKLNFRFDKNFKTNIGISFILYALIIYPLLGLIFNHTYPNNPTFGLPCPTTIFTFGILLMTKEKLPIYLIIIPLLWSILGLSAAMNFGIKEDLGLTIAGITGSILLFIEILKSKKITTG